MDTQAPVVRSPQCEVLKFFESRHESGADPFGDVLELFYFMKKSGSALDDLDVGVAVGRLVCGGQLWYALDGIRLVDR